MAKQLSEARNKRFDIISRRTAGILRSNSPVSSTGSCHGTVVSDDNTSEFFSEMEEDFANGDVWNSTGDFMINSNEKKLNSDNIRSTAKKHGRWQPRASQHVPFSASNIASAFPDFTSIGEATTEENVITTTGESISLEIARGSKYPSNTASPRQSQSQSHQDLASASNNQKKSASNTRQTGNSVLKSTGLENSKSTPKANNKVKATGAQSNQDQKNIARMLLNKNLFTSNPNLNTAHGSHTEQQSNKTFQPRISNELDQSAMVIEQLTTKISSNNNPSDTYSSKQLNKTTVRQKSTRFVDSRQRLTSEEKLVPQKEGPSNFSHDTRYVAMDISQEHTPFKRNNVLAAQPQNPLDHTGNPTQSSASFLIPWNNNNQSNTTNLNGFPIFTAQGAVQTTKLPHEYVDAVDLPPEEEHIYDMIENMKSQNSKAQDIIDSLQCKKSQLAEENIYVSTRKRSDSGLGDSGSENLNPSTRLLETELLESKKLNAYLQRKLEDYRAAKEQLQIKCHSLESKIKSLHETDNQVTGKISGLQKFDGYDSAMAHDFKAGKIQTHENRIPKPDIEKLDQEFLDSATQNRRNDHGTQAQISSDQSLSSEIWKLSSLYETLKQRNSTLTALNEELMAENWTHTVKNRELFTRMQELLAEKQRLERDIAHNMGKSHHKTNLQTDSSVELEEMKLKRDRETADWAAKAQQYEDQIEKLGMKIKELQSKLARSEKSCRILKTNTERIMESTHEIQTSKSSKSQLTSTNRKDKRSKKTSRSETYLQVESPDKCLTKGLLHSQANDNLTIESNLTDRSFNGDESSMHSTKRHTIDVNTHNVSTSSNFSEILGHGFAEKLREAANSLEDIAAREHAVNTQTDVEETINSTINGTTTQSIKSSAPAYQIARDLAATISQEKFLASKNLKRSMSLLEKNSKKNFTVNSQKSTRRHSTNSHGNFLAQDLKNSAAQVNNFAITPPKNRNKLNPDSHNFAVSNSPKKNADENYTSHAQVSSKTHGATKKTVRVERPIPVSDRVPVTGQYEDEPTVRPSISPGLALAMVIKDVKDDINSLKNKLDGVHRAYISHDPSLGKKTRKELADLINTFVKKIEVKTEQLYHLYNVLEGQKISQQEMTDEFVDLTLTELGINLDDTWNGFDF